MEKKTSDTDSPNEERGNNEDSLRISRIIPFQLDEEKKFFVANMAFNLTPQQVKDWFAVRN